MFSVAGSLLSGQSAGDAGSEWDCRFVLIEGKCLGNRIKGLEMMCF